jgi:hypothetical protein
LITNILYCIKLTTNATYIFTSLRLCIITNKQTPWWTFLVQKLMVATPVNKFPAFYRMWRVTAMFRGTVHSFLIPVIGQTTPGHTSLHISLTSILKLSSHLRTESLCAFPTSHTYATRPVPIHLPAANYSIVQHINNTLNQ